MSNLNDIVNVSIELNAPAVSGESFSNILLVGPRPVAWNDWEKTTAYVTHDIVVAGTHVYECSVGGTSGSTAPTHGSGTAEDGEVTWQYLHEVPAEVGVYRSLSEVADAGWDVTGTSEDHIGIASRIAFSQKPTPACVYIAPLIKEERAAAAVTRALKTKGWYVVCTAGVPENQFAEVAALIETQDKMFGYTYTEGTDPVDTIYFRTFGYFGLEYDNQKGGEVPVVNKYIAVGAAARCLSYPSGSETWAFKDLAALYPSKLTGTKLNELKEANVNTFENVAGKNVIKGGVTKAGEWIDLIRFRDWLKNDMQFRVMNLLLTSPKIPYTDAGIALVENQMRASLIAGTAAGGISPDEYDSLGNLEPGFKIHVPRSSEISASQKASRVLSGCNFEANIAGAIHMVKISGALVYPN